MSSAETPSDPFIAAARRRRLTCDDCGRRCESTDALETHRWAFHYGPRPDGGDE